MRKSNWKVRALLFAWIVIAAFIAWGVVHLILPVLGEWGQTVFFILWIVIGGIGVIQIGKYKGRRR